MKTRSMACAAVSLLDEAPGTVILASVVGSRAYGLATEASDVDVGGVFVAPTAQVLGLSKVPESFVHTNPDVSLHELGHFFRLAAKANPTILERLFIDNYEVLTVTGASLIQHRDWFLSQLVRRTYGGFAMSQFRRLQGSAPSDARRQKSARHCFRLLRQGRELLETGGLSVRVADPDELFEIGRLDDDDLAARFVSELAGLDEVKSSLPETPDLERLSALLVGFRSRF